MLASALEVPDIAAHSPGEIDWDALPDGFLVAMHWHRTPVLQEILKKKKAEVLVTVRHPLDVLISILRFCQFEPATARWLDGEGGNEAVLLGADPTDSRFLQYALSDRVAALLSVSLEWRREAKVIVHYEKLVDDRYQTLSGVLNAVGESPLQSLQDAIASYELGRLKAITGRHCWLGRPGVWRFVLVDEYRRAIYQRHRDVFDSFGYAVEPTLLSDQECRDNWNKLLASESHPEASGAAPE